MEFINFQKTILLRSLSISSIDLINAAIKANTYICNLVNIFDEINFDIFYSLGQRNISGFIGEVYKNFLANSFSSLCANPHPDGRPDILAVDTPNVIKYYSTCFAVLNGRRVPIKDKFTPFKYGGLEVKCSIGTSNSSKTKKYLKDKGHTFNLYEPRVGYLSGITWWAHHSSSSNLLGLYYDYYEPLRGIPQILAAFYSELSSDDWQPVSHGDPTHKKTSNTSLNTSGLTKMKNNCVFCISDPNYLNQLHQIKVKID